MTKPASGMTRVTVNLHLDGHLPGDVVDLPDHQAAAMVARGHAKPSRAKTVTADDTDGDADGES